MKRRRSLFFRPFNRLALIDQLSMGVWRCARLICSHYINSSKQAAFRTSTHYCSRNLLARCLLLPGIRLTDRHLLGDDSGPSATAAAEAAAAASVQQGLTAAATNTFTQTAAFNNPYAPVSVSAAFGAGVAVGVGPGAHTGASTSVTG
jgi:hypothetical protein